MTKTGRRWYCTALWESRSPPLFKGEPLTEVLLFLLLSAQVHSPLFYIQYNPISSFSFFMFPFPFIVFSIYDFFLYLLFLFPFKDFFSFYFFSPLFYTSLLLFVIPNHSRVVWWLTSLFC